MIASQTGRKVFSGPFKGMKFLKNSFYSSYFPKLIGTYEKELHNAILSVPFENIENTVVIGAAEGYYAIGFALHFKSNVIAYESSAEGRAMMKRLMDRNKQKIEIHSACFPTSLNLDSTSAQFFFMDIEGEELDFLQEGVFEKYDSSYWIIEIHSYPSLKKFEDKLSDIFNFDFIPVRDRRLSDYPEKFLPSWYFLFSRYFKSLLQEWRSDSIGWLYLVPKI